MLSKTCEKLEIVKYIQYVYLFAIFLPFVVHFHVLSKTPRTINKMETITKVSTAGFHKRQKI